MSGKDDNKRPLNGKDRPSLIERVAESLGSIAGEDVAATPQEQLPHAEEPATATARPAARDRDKSTRNPCAPVAQHLRMHEGILGPDVGRSRLLEEFRIIKRTVLKNSMGERRNGSAHGNLVMVSSTRPGEGKTTVAINLALSIALERDFTVLLFDGDLAKPSILNTFGIEAEAGLVDVLDDPEADLEDVFIPTDVEGLSLVPSGRSHMQNTELLASERMRQVLEKLAKSDPRRIVVFDSPPALSSSEPNALASYMDQIVFVIEADRTPSSAVQQALRLIDADAKVGLVLNKTRPQFGAVQFGSYYKAYEAEA